MTTNNQTLELIAEKIRTHEKGNISGVVAIGRLLSEAEDQCAHGEYMSWVARHFGWSHATTLRYRRAFEFANSIDDFEKLNLTLTALYFVANLSLSAASIDTSMLRMSAQKAIIRKARKHRVTVAVAKAIFEKIKNPHPIDPVEDETPPPPPGPAQPAQPDDRDDDHDPVDDEPDNVDAVEDDSGNVPQHQIAAALLRTLLQKFPADSSVWPGVVQDIGQVETRRCAELMNAVVANHCENDPVKAKADRAEAKSRGQLYQNRTEA
jgi:hypothetical protein